MSQTSLSPSLPAAQPDRALAGLAFLQPLLFMVPIVVLGAAIGWPASLRLPATEVLPLIREQAAAVQIGYWAYLLVSLAMLPFAVAMRRFLAIRGVTGLVSDTALGLAVAAAILKILGIVRWLVAMPALADAHAAAPDAAARAAIEYVYLGLNGYAGAVGELLGVQLTGGLYFLMAGVALSQAGWRKLGLSGAFVGALFLATCVRTFHPPAAALQGIAVPLLLLWCCALGLVAWRGR